MCIRSTSSQLLRTVMLAWQNDKTLQYKKCLWELRDSKCLVPTYVNNRALLKDGITKRSLGDCTYFLSIFNPQQSRVAFYVKAITNWSMHCTIHLGNCNCSIMFQSFGKGVPGRSKFLREREHFQVSASFNMTLNCGIYNMIFIKQKINQCSRITSSGV